MNRLIPALVATTLFFAAACSTPSTPTVTGQWSGTIADSAAGSGTLQATIAQSGSQLTGTWTSAFANASNGGTVSGNLSGSTVSLTLTPGNSPTCAISLTTTVLYLSPMLATQPVIAGPYASVNCGAAVTGSLTLTEQTPITLQ